MTEATSAVGVQIGSSQAPIDLPDSPTPSQGVLAIDIDQIDDSHEGEYLTPDSNSNRIPDETQISASPTIKDTPSNPIKINDPETTSKSNASHCEKLFKFGPYVPMLRKGNNIIIDPDGIVKGHALIHQSPLDERRLCEVFPDDAIVSAPSLITPLLLKKKTKWPTRISEPKIKINIPNGTSDNCDLSTTEEPMDTSQASSAEDVQIVKVVGGAAESPQPVSMPPPKFNSNSKAVDEYVNSTTMANLTGKKVVNNKSILTIENYFKSSVGEMLLGIGLSRVMEHELQESARVLRSRMRGKSGEEHDFMVEEFSEIKDQLLQTKASNKVFKADKLLRCPHCPFKSEFAIVLDHHLETPHLTGRKEFMCNWCDYKIRDSSQFVFHNYTKHKKRCRFDKPAAVHNCRFCFYECKSKRKMTTHLIRCELMFSNDNLLGPQDYGEDDYPAITSKLITQEDVKTYESTLKTLRLAAYNPNQIRISGSQQPVLLVPRPNGGLPNPGGHSSNAIRQGNYIALPTGAILGQQSNAGPHNSARLMYLLSAQHTNSASLKTGAVQYPRGIPSSFLNGKAVIRAPSDVIMTPQNSNLSNSYNQFGRSLPQSDDTSKSGDVGCGYPSPYGGVQSPGSVANSKASTFVICEICDCFIKDLSQFKSHMNSIHKVKIHQKTLKSRPPLSCQKCQWRFFSDQGLERHLLGAHSLVTSNMQDLVDQSIDSGKCTVCGLAFMSKLVTHMKEVHKSNLKPAHLSYKCTVCQATFNLYRLFENHVYSLHSESVKRIPSN